MNPETAQDISCVTLYESKTIDRKAKVTLHDVDFKCWYELDKWDDGDQVNLLMACIIVDGKLSPDIEWMMEQPVKDQLEALILLELGRDKNGD